MANPAYAVTNGSGNACDELFQGDLKYSGLGANVTGYFGNKPTCAKSQLIKLGALLTSDMRRYNLLATHLLNAQGYLATDEVWVSANKSMVAIRTRKGYAYYERRSRIHRERIPLDRATT